MTAAAPHILCTSRPLITPRSSSALLSSIEARLLAIALVPPVSLSRRRLAHSPQLLGKPERKLNRRVGDVEPDRPDALRLDIENQKTRQHLRDDDSARFRRAPVQDLRASDGSLILGHSMRSLKPTRTYSLAFAMYAAREIFF